MSNFNLTYQKDGENEQLYYKDAHNNDLYIRSCEDFAPAIIQEKSGNPIDITDGADCPIRKLKVIFEPIQDLHGQANPYPAGGGKNKAELTEETIAKPSWYTGAWIGTSLNDSNGITQARGFGEGGAGGFTASLLEGTYTFSMTYSGDTVQCRIYVASYDGESPTIVLNNVIMSNSGTRYYISFDVPSGSTEIAIRPAIYSTTEAYDLTDIQLELGSIATAFAPYSNICPITGRDSVTVWREASYNPSADPALTIQLGDTIYGGTLDVSTGKLTVTHGEIASYNGEVLTGEWISDRDVYAVGTTPTIGAQVVYVLDTPQTIQLDPATLSTLKGENTFSTDGTSIELEYVVDTKTYIDNLINSGAKTVVKPNDEIKIIDENKGVE